MNMEESNLTSLVFFLLQVRRTQSPMKKNQFNNSVNAKKKSLKACIKNKIKASVFTVKGLNTFTINIKRVCMYEYTFFI